MTRKADFALDWNWKACPLKSRVHEDPRKTEALIKAAASGDVDVVERLLSDGARVWHCDADGGTALHFAAYYNQVKVARLLVSCHAELDICKRNGTRATPLHGAAMHGHQAVAALLKTAGADLATTDAWGRTPHEVAQLRGHHEVASLLLPGGLEQNHSVQNSSVQFDTAPSTEIIARASDDSTRVRAEEGRAAFFDLCKNAQIFAAAGLGQIRDPRLLVIFMDTLSTEVFDVIGLAEPFEFGSWSVEGTRILAAELLRLATVIVANMTSNYSRVLLIGPTGYDGWPPDCWTRSLKSVVSSEPENSPLRALRLTLRGAVPKARLIVYNPNEGCPQFWRETG
jgi:hypothetical protein